MGFFASDAEIAQSAAGTASMAAYNNGNRLDKLQQTVNSIDTFCGSAGNYLMAMGEQNIKILEKMDQLIADNKELRNKVSRLEEQVNRTSGYAR